MGGAVDSGGNVYVTDSGNYRIQKFRNDGGFIRTWGGFGFGDGRFIFPRGVAVDSSANVFIADNSRIQKFDTRGIFTTKWGSHGSADGQFRSADAVVVKSAKVSIQEERVFVADSQNNRIQVFKPKLVVNP
jgi:tripartite motif-containing protein 71